MNQPNPFHEIRQDLPIIFWPILYLSMRWFQTYTAELIALGHEHIQWHVTWYGKIKVTWVDTPDPLRGLRNLESWQTLEAKLNATPWTTLSGDICVLRRAQDEGRCPDLFLGESPRWIPAFAGIAGTKGLCPKLLDPG